MSRREMPQPVDFLDRIVAKARGLESAIAPRLPSRFEPLAGAIVPSPEDASEQPTSVLKSKAEPIAADPSPRAAQRTTEAYAVGIPGLDVTARRDEAEETNDAEVQITEKSPDAVASLLPSAIVPNFVERMVTQDTGHAAMKTAESDSVSAAGQRPSAEVLGSLDMSTRVWRTPISVNASLARNSENAPAGPGEFRIDQPKQGHKSGDLEFGALTPSPVAALVPRIGVLPAAKSANEPGGISLAKEREPQAPVINVTIGRVEVRAVQAQSAKPRLEPAKPKPLGLDDYLKRRGGRR